MSASLRFTICSLISTLAFGPLVSATPLTPLWNLGPNEGNTMATASMDVDGDGIKDILCIKTDLNFSSYTTSFKIVKGNTFSELYDWVTPPGVHSSLMSTADIDKNGSYELTVVSVTTTATNQYQGKVIIYRALDGSQIWESEPFSITSSVTPTYPLVSAFPTDLLGTDEYEWVVNYNEDDPDTGTETGRVKVYQKDTGSVGFTQKLWEQTYPNGQALTSSTYYDLNRDGKPDLSVNFQPQEWSTSNGAIIFYQPSGLTSFTELVRFETSQPGNELSLLYTQSSLQQLYPTRVDKGISAGILLFQESWTESGKTKSLVQAYRADPPFSAVGTLSYEGGTLGVYPNDCDGDGWDELVLDYWKSTDSTSKVAVCSVQGGNFTLNTIWENEEKKGNYLVLSHWDLNSDTKVDIGIQWLPLDTDMSSSSTLTFYQMAGGTFSPLYQFSSSYPGGKAYLDPIEPTHQRVAGPTEYLYQPVDLDCTTGSDLAIINTYERYAYSPLPTYEQDGKIQIYNLPSKSLSWESSSFGYYLHGGSIANLRSYPSNDLIFSATRTEFSVSWMQITGDIYVYGCGQSTDTTTTTSISSTSTTTTSVPGQTTTTTTTGDELCAVEELYGSDAPETALLRFIRDEILLKNPEGTALVKLYYALSPVVVEMLRSQESLREEIRHLIDRIIREL